MNITINFVYLWILFVFYNITFTNVLKNKIIIGKLLLENTSLVNSWDDWNTDLMT